MDYTHIVINEHYDGDIHFSSFSQESSVLNIISSDTTDNTYKIFKLYEDGRTVKMNIVFDGQLRLVEVTE
jgi:hypothetical protein